MQKAWNENETRQISLLPCLKFSLLFFWEITQLKICKRHSTMQDNARQDMCEVLNCWWCSADLHQFMVKPDCINICAWSHLGPAVDEMAVLVHILCLRIELFLMCIFLAYFKMPIMLFTICCDRWGCCGAKKLSVFLMNSFIIASWFNSKPEKLHLKLSVVWINLMKETKAYIVILVTAFLVSSIDQEDLQQ